MAVGLARHEVAIARRYKKQPGEPAKLLYHQSGAMGEGMCADWAGVSYRPLKPGVPDYGGDIAPGVEVKATHYKEGMLPVQERNEVHAAYILVTDSLGMAPMIQGWTWGWYARQIGDYRAGGQWKTPAFWVESDRLFRSEDRMRVLRFMTQYAAGVLP